MTWRAMKSWLLAVLRLVRPQQWSKNLLVAAPLLSAHAWQDPANLRLVLLCWLLFNALASAVYVLNDALDCVSDRMHPVKCKRPFASGALKTRTGLGVMLALLAVGAVLMTRLPAATNLTVLAYVGLALAYCFLLKQVAWLDVLLLAALFTIRLIAGAVVIEVELSPWLLAFSMFLFFSLATLKRFAELQATRAPSLHGRGYEARDVVVLMAFGVAAAMASVLVLALYLNSGQVERLYQESRWLWGMGPVLIYWQARLWSIAQRGELRLDPLAFALRDVPSWFCAVLMVACFAQAL